MKAFVFCFLLLSCCCRDKIELYIHPFVSHNANVFWVLMLHTTTAGIAAGDETELEAAHTGTCVRTKTAQVTPILSSSRRQNHRDFVQERATMSRS
jgi:hypothetical protein